MTAVRSSMYRLGRRGIRLAFSDASSLSSQSIRSSAVYAEPQLRQERNIAERVWPKDASVRSVIRLLLPTCLSAVVVSIFVRALLMESFFIPSTSMVPTLQPRDYVVVTKLSYGLQAPFLQRRVVAWSTPTRGEIVVFRRKDDPRTP